MSDIQIIELLKKGGSEVHKTLAEFYECNRTRILKYVKQNNGSEEDGKDVLQDSIIALYSNIIKDRFNGESSLETYLFSIARNKWLSILKRKKMQQKIVDNFNQIIESSEVTENLNDYKSEITSIFSQLGKSCKELLIKYFYYNFSNNELVKHMGYDNEQIVRNKKFKCMKKLKSLINEKPEVLNFFNTIS